MIIMTTVAQFSSLILLLSLALTSPANCWTNGTTVEYWVRPDTMSECPHSIPPHQCVTITDLVTNSTDTSINDGMSINVFFIAGTHVPKANGWIVVGNPYLNQEVSATFAAISDGPNQQNAIIDCESGHPISFVFLQLLSLTLKNVELQNCGFKLHFNSTKDSSTITILNKTTSSVVVMNVPELVMANINITSSRGAGMVIILNKFDKNVNINRLMLNEIVIHGSNDTGNKFAGNLYVMFSAFEKNTLKKPTIFSINNSIFSNGIGRCSENAHFVFECFSGGLTISIFMVNLHNVSVLINRCKFMDNKAPVGGGIGLFIDESIIGLLFMEHKHTFDNFSLNHIHITKSIFSRNTAVGNGGGLAIESDTFLFHNNIICCRHHIDLIRSISLYVNISETVFRYNSAQVGGATYTSFIQFSFDRCTFIGNEAILGAAVYSEYSIDQQISNCTFIHNTCRTNTATTDEERYETGTIHIQSRIFLKDVEITGNDCRDKITISMKHNTAMEGGDAIYGGNLKFCHLWNFFDIMERNTSSAVSSPPNKVCICSDDFPQKHTCSHFMQLDTYPGQRLQVPLVCVGQYNYSSPCKVQAHLEMTSIANIAEEAILQNIAKECKQLYYSIETQQTNYTETLSLTIVKEQDSNYEWSDQIIPTVIEIRIKACPPGFTQNNNARKCTCTDYLASNGITCNIDEERLHKISSMWVGNYLGDVVVHQVCPFDYCKSNFTKVNPFNQQEQCDFNRIGVLCGACRPGLSLVLGTSQCKECSNINLLLLILFALAGVVLVVLLLKCNLTVSTGTINGLIFYANIVQSTQTAFFPSSTDNKFVSILSVFVAWVNLDLGIETCFVNGLNTYYRTWLQFIFPLYIWTIVGLLILISRYSIKVSKWTGSNTVSVLATLFLLSYAKLLRTTFDTFSSTTLTDVNGTLTTLWLLDGRYTFLDWPHSLLFAAGLFILLAHILPFTILLLMAPILQRYTHYKLLRWVNKLKPLLDAYQGPYGVKSRYWTGLLLLARLVILTAVSLNVSGKQAINLLVINIVLSILMIILMAFGIAIKLYTSKLSNFLELFFLANLLLLTATSLFLQSNQTDKISGQSITICCMVGSAFAMCLILAYHCYVVCQRIEAIKRLTSRIVSSLKGPRNRALTNDDIIRGPPHSTPPTVTKVDLRELLLEDNYNH
ncbi:uncharacterized protein LOC135336882 [Halichondria panicea]|uniref:uncharacterized protein LOC135336882 n=1 Tax=Halichondria panicea TaxID=6063 RepID=UPI00312B893E